MSKRKAFWGQSGAIRRPCPRPIDGKLLDAVIGSQGIAFFSQGVGSYICGLTWEEMYRLAQQDRLEQLGAAVAERSEPRILPAEDFQHEEDCPCYGDTVEHGKECGNCECDKAAFENGWRNEEI